MIIKIVWENGDKQTLDVDQEVIDLINKKFSDNQNLSNFLIYWDNKGKLVRFVSLKSVREINIEY